MLLAVGADNVFILVMDIQRENTEGKSVDDVIAKVLGKGGPSMMLCALTEMTVFLIGSMSEMPAVKVFALNAGLAILFNFVLQLTGFLAVEKRRERALRLKRRALRFLRPAVLLALGCSSWRSPQGVVRASEARGA